MGKNRTKNAKKSTQVKGEIDRVTMKNFIQNPKKKSNSVHKERIVVCCHEHVELIGHIPNFGKERQSLLTVTEEDE